MPGFTELSTYNIIDSMKRRLKITKLSDYKKIKDIPDHKISGFIKSMNQRVVREMMDNPDGVKMVERLGYFSIRRYKSTLNINSKRSSNIDWVTSKKLGKKVTYFNDHSDGYKIIYQWIRPEMFLFKGFYYFDFARCWDRELARLVKAGKEYLIINKLKK